MNIERKSLEQFRVEDLASYGILDTSTDPQFDKITKLASALCGTPIALVSLIDEGRQWFKSKVGLLGVDETPRDISFCTVAIMQDSLMEVPDALEDDRFKNNPLVQGDPNIRFYAGAQLRSPRGNNLGTLCVIDSKPHELTDFQREALDTLSEQVVELMELHKRNRELLEARNKLKRHQRLLVSKARLQSLGELAGGICHQINNPLSIILGQTMMLRSRIAEKLPNENEMISELNMIDKTSHRIGDILKVLKTYAKDNGVGIAKEDLNQVIQETLFLLKNKLNEKNVTLTYEKPVTVELRFDKHHVAQILLELVSNSIEAMADSAERQITLRVDDSPSHVTIIVSDTGHGIPSSDKDKIFVPFFTTKANRFGVGLSNALSYMNQHKGELLLVKEMGPTTFKLRLSKNL
jgi:two-component system, NtrC family, sensor kinase